METDWGTNVGTLLGGLLVAGLLASGIMEAGSVVGLPEFVSTTLAFVAGLVGFFGVLYLFYRIYLDDAPEPT